MITRHSIPAGARDLLLCLALATGATPAGAEPTTTPTLTITADDFVCVQDMTPVRGFFVDNLLGDLSATVAIAESPTGGTYPPGSVVQLVPGEVMVKHPAGFNPATRDWEFFELDVAPEGATIRARGFVDVVNRFDGNCFACHVKAEPQWDMICETGHGCDPIPLTRPMVEVLQKADPRCESSRRLSDDETALLRALMPAGT